MQYSDHCHIGTRYSTLVRPCIQVEQKNDDRSCVNLLVLGKFSDVNMNILTPHSHHWAIGDKRHQKLPHRIILGSKIWKCVIVTWIIYMYVKIATLIQGFKCNFFEIRHMLLMLCGLNKGQYSFSTGLKLKKHWFLPKSQIVCLPEGIYRNSLHPLKYEEISIAIGWILTCDILI